MGWLQVQHLHHSYLLGRDVEQVLTSKYVAYVMPVVYRGGEVIGPETVSAFDDKVSVLGRQVALVVSFYRIVKDDMR